MYIPAYVSPIKLALLTIHLRIFSEALSPFAPRTGSQITGLTFQETIQWDPAKDSWPFLYVKMCGVFCDGDRMITIQNLGFGSCKHECYKCDCGTMCGFYGTCCPKLDSANLLRPEDIEYKAPYWHFTGDVSVLKMKDSNSNGFVKYLTANPGTEVYDEFDGRLQCIRIRFRNEKPKFYEQVFAVAECPEKEPDGRLRQLCESRDPNLTTTDQLLPISDLKNGIVFKNVYCLKCWQKHRPGVNESPSLEDDPSTLTDYDTNLFLRWNLTVKCTIYQSLYKFTDVSKFLSTLLENIQSSPYPIAPYCDIRLKFNDEAREEYLKPKSCYPHHRPNAQTPKCVGTKPENEIASKLCVLANKPAYSLAGAHNVFCEFCNDTNVYCSQEQHGIDLFNGIEYDSSPINFLLGDDIAVVGLSDEFQTSDVNETYLCPGRMEWLDDADTCQLPRCTDGKVLDINKGQCKTVIPIIEGLGYKLSIVLTPEHKMSSSAAFDIKMVVEQFYEEMIKVGYLAVYMVVFGTGGSEKHDVIKYIKIQGNFIAKPGLMRDEFETMFLNFRFQVLLSSDQNNNTVALKRGGMGIDHVNRMGIREYTQGNPEDQYHLPDQWIETEIPNTVTLDQLEGAAHGHEVSKRDAAPSSRSRDTQQLVTYKNVLYSTVGTPKISHPTWQMKSKFIDMTPVLLCPYVAFDIKDTAEINETKLLITFYYKGREKTIDTSTHDRNLTIEGMKVKICIETFREVFQKMVIPQQVSNQTNVGITWMSRVIRHLTICCPALSVICLLMTSITYCVFSQLRTVPGLNTLCLCLTLASAHLTLILVVELVGYVDEYVCVALGIALHYTWLASFFWMGLCGVHTYLVFRRSSSNTRQSSTRDPSEKQSEYQICAFGISAVIVSVHICVCEIVSDGRTTGYSDQVCFFDTQWSILTVLVSFVAPLVTLLFINTVLFGITVREMAKVKHMQLAVRQAESREELLTYVKLSTITGVQWLVSLLAVKLNSHVIDIAAALLVGLQGVFIFASFTLNKNTRGLFKNICGGNGVSLDASSTRKNNQYSSVHATQVTEV